MGIEVWVSAPGRTEAAAPTSDGTTVGGDTRTDRVVGTVELPRANPVTPWRWMIPGRTLLVGTVGSYRTVGDGAVERIDVVDGAPVVGDALVR